MERNEILAFDGKSSKVIAFESAEDWLAWTQGEDASKDPYTSSAWYYAVVRKRAAMVRAIPRIVMGSGGNEVKEKDLPFRIDLSDLLFRSSVSLDRYAASYWAKIGNGNALQRVRFLDPTTIEPIYGMQGGGLQYFKRSVGGRQIRIEYDPETETSPDLGWVWLHDTNEAGPGMAPEHVAKRPANILGNIDKFAENFFDRGAISQHWITAATNPGPEEKERLIAKIKRALFGGVDTSHGVEVFSEGLTVDKIGSDPKELELEIIDKANMVDVGAVLETPRMIISPDEAANRATLDRVWSSWIEYAVVPHAEMIVDALNYHILEPAGYSLALNANALTISQEDERQRALAFSYYVNAGVDAETAAAMLGLDIPDGMELMADEPLVLPTTQSPAGGGAEEDAAEIEPAEDDESKAVELGRLRRFIVNGRHRKRTFHSDILTQVEIDREVGKAEDAPFPGDGESPWESYP
jgi:hypothetical protein